MYQKIKYIIIATMFLLICVVVLTLDANRRYNAIKKEQGQSCRHHPQAAYQCAFVTMTGNPSGPHPSTKRIGQEPRKRNQRSKCVFQATHLRKESSLQRNLKLRIGRRQKSDDEKQENHRQKRPEIICLNLLSCHNIQLKQL